MLFRSFRMGFEGDFVEWTDKKILQIKEKIVAGISHSYLREQLEKPSIDEDKLFILLAILSSQKLTDEHIEEYARTVMLIQIALDTHDRVTNEKDPTDLKYRQLTVLAGDYYSGLYYRTLAYLPNIELIKDLAEGIKMVNEKKISIYSQEITSLTQFFEGIQIIQTAIYQKLALHFNDQAWAEISANWLHLNHLLKNIDFYKEQILVNQYKIRSIGNSRELDSTRSQKLEDWINQYISILRENLEQELVDYPNVRKILNNNLQYKIKINQPSAL